MVSHVDVLSRNPVQKKNINRQKKLAKMSSQNKGKHDQDEIQRELRAKENQRKKEIFLIFTCLQNRYPSISLLLSQNGVYARGLPFISMS